MAPDGDRSTSDGADGGHWLQGRGNWEASDQAVRPPRTRWRETALGWLPEGIGALLAVLTLAVGPSVARVLDQAAKSFRAAEAATWIGQRSWLDIGVGPSSMSGEAVTWVAPYGASAGILQAGDVISAVDGHPVTSLSELHSLIGTEPAGTVVRLEVVRGSRLLHLNVRLGSTPPFYP